LVLVLVVVEFAAVVLELDVVVELFALLFGVFVETFEFVVVVVVVD